MANTKITSRVIADNAVGISALNVSDGSDGQVLTTNGSGTLSFADGGVAGITSSADATAITIDSSENVGIGTTSPSGEFHVDSGLAPCDIHFTTGSSGGTGYDVNLNMTGGANNAEMNLNMGISGDADREQIKTYQSTMRFRTNNAERMRINSAGKVGIGTDSPSSILHIEGDTNGYGTAPILYFGSISTANSAVRDWAIGPADSNYGDFHIYQGASTGASPLATSNAKLTINASGNVGINTATPASYDNNAAGISSNLVVKDSGHSGIVVISGTSSDAAISFGDGTGAAAYRGAIAYVNSQDKLYFKSAGSNRMVIDSSGHLLVGKTSAAVTVQGTEIRSNGEFFSTIPSPFTTLHVYSSTAQAYRFYVTHAGQIHATSTSITGISDERLKENIVDLETGLSEVMALQPRRFDWKNGDGENVAGFIAQEVETVLPELIGDFKHDSLTDAKSLRMGDMLPTLVKAIQEQQTIIDDLKSRIETLEG